MRNAWVIETDKLGWFVCDEGERQSDDIDRADVFRTREQAKKEKRAGEKIRRVQVKVNLI